MTNNAYQELVQQAWTTYSESQAKYRGGDYNKLLEPLSDTLVQQLSGVDTLISALGKSSPPSSETLNAAEKQFGLIEGTLDNISNVLDQFPDMDKKAVSKAACLDQPALRTIYAGVQNEDAELFAAYATTVFSAQEAAARAMGVFAANPELATS